jgi:colanic acid biosynthesis glycosyl transferase WcaI
LKLLILSLNYSPEPTGFAPHTTALAEHLAGQGHSVTAVTGFPFAPRWARWPEYRRRFITRGMINGVRVVRVSHFIPRRPGSALQRILMEGSFAATALVALLPRLATDRRFDAVLYVGAQPAIAWLARIVAALQRAPYVVKITDLAAQAAVDVGITGPGTFARLLVRIEYAAYRRARAAIVLCDAFRTALVDDGFSPDAVHLIRDSVDLDAIRPDADGAAFRGRYGIADDEFVVLYAGSLGLKQGMFDVVDAARLVADECPDVRWVFVGEGETRQALVERIRSAGLKDRLLLLPLQPESQLSEMLAAADLLLLSQRRTMKDTVIPSKLLMYMAAGRPVLAAVNPGSQAATIIRDSGGGILIAAEDPKAMAEAVREARGRHSVLDAMAKSNRAFAEEHFNRASIVRAQQHVIEQVVVINAV